MSATITLNSRIENAKKYINDNFDPSSDGNYSYFYTGRTLPWNDEYSPDISTSSIKDLNLTLSQRVFLKQIGVSDCSLAIKRFDWKKYVIYTRADSDINYTSYKNWIHPESPFYVFNSEGNVYKCISNNYNSPSLVEPIGQSSDYINLGDGYVWKFMLGITTPISEKFLTKLWIPIPYDDINKDFSQILVENNATDGDIAYIHINNGGLNYSVAPSIQIRGDGVGATATAIMIGESIDKIQINTHGSGYTYANVLIHGNGTDAIATAMISPPGGHGSNASMELGSFYVEMTSEIIGDEDTVAPITGTYRNIGIVKNTKDNNGDIITDVKLNTLSSINVINCSGDYLVGELIIGENSYAQGILYYDPSGTDKYIEMYMIEGDFIDGEILHGQETGKVGEYVESMSNITTVDINSGSILYKENIVFITRRQIQTEKFVFTTEF